MISSIEEALERLRNSPLHKVLRTKINLNEALELYSTSPTTRTLFHCSFCNSNHTITPLLDQMCFACRDYITKKIEDGLSPGGLK